MTLRKTFEGDLKKMELTLGTAEREVKERNYPELINEKKEEEV